MVIKSYKLMHTAFEDATVRQVQVFEWLYCFKEGMSILKVIGVLDTLNLIETMNK
jgi:hypothetical protein